jgi:hypothetical protein
VETNSMEKILISDFSAPAIILSSVAVAEFLSLQ